ncbi:MAG: hypothetical protein ACM3NQ_12675 [Bacteroidales bacterium]
MSNLPVTWWLCCALLVVLSALAVVPSYVNHDAAWYLYMARRVMDGAVMYRDVVDTNPPLIVWLTIVPAWLARFALSDVILFKLFVYAIAFAALGACAQLAGRIWPDWRPGLRGLLVATTVFVALPFPKTDFGQREHFVLLMTLPYVFASAAWLRGFNASRTSAAVIGVVGGLGFAVKPHYLLGWLAVELALLFVRRPAWRRPQAVAAACAICLYGATVLLVVPQYLALAQVVAAVYGGINASAAVMLRVPDVQFWAICLVLLAVVRLPERSRWTCLVLFAAATGLLAGGLLQLKAWSYHLLPGRAFMLLFLATMSLSALEALPSVVSAIRGGARGVAWAGGILLLLWSGRYVAEARRPAAADLVTPLAQLVRAQAPGGRLALLSMRTMVYPAFPLVNYTGAEWALRHNSLWFLPGLYDRQLQVEEEGSPGRAPGAMSPVERRFFEEIVGDLCAAPPDLLIIEAPLDRAPAGWRALDLNAYYGRAQRYRRLLTSYAPLTTVAQFVVFKRTAPASCR